MSSVLVRKFTNEGVLKFGEFLKARDLSKIAELVSSSNFTVSSKGTLELSVPRNRLELAENLWSLFGEGGELYGSRSDSNLWNWISAVYLPVLLAADSRSNLEAKFGKEEERWILTSSTLRYHRHLVSGPFFAYEANYPHIERAMCLLATPVLAPGEVVERIAGKRSLSFGAVCHLATLLYFDAETEILRFGVTSPPGNPKSFSRYFSQIDRTLDYEGMEVEDLLDTLPKNFDKWKSLAHSDLQRQKG